MPVHGSNVAVLVVASLVSATSSGSESGGFPELSLFGTGRASVRVLGAEITCDEAGGAGVVVALAREINGGGAVPMFGGVDLSAVAQGRREDFVLSEFNDLLFHTQAESASCGMDETYSSDDAERVVSFVSTARSGLTFEAALAANTIAATGGGQTPLEGILADFLVPNGGGERDIVISDNRTLLLWELGRDGSYNREFNDLVLLLDIDCAVVNGGNIRQDRFGINATGTNDVNHAYTEGEVIMPSAYLRAGGPFIGHELCGVDVSLSAPATFYEAEAIVSLEGFLEQATFLGAWGPCSGCPEDLDEDGSVGFGDILVVLGGWGPCP